MKDARLEELESIVIRLDAKVTRLEGTAQQQELLIKKLFQKDIGVISSPISERSLGEGVSFFRTCRELHATEPSLSSDMYWIDPDGLGVGDDPIYVYCDMA